MDSTQPTQDTPQETLPTARRGRGRPRASEPSRMLRVRTPAALLRRLDALMPCEGQRSAAVREAIEMVIAKREAAAAVPPVAA